MYTSHQPGDPLPQDPSSLVCDRLSKFFQDVINKDVVHNPDIGHESWALENGRPRGILEGEEGGLWGKLNVVGVFLRDSAICSPGVVSRRMEGGWRKRRRR